MLLLSYTSRAVLEDRCHLIDDTIRDIQTLLGGTQGTMLTNIRCMSQVFYSREEPNKKDPVSLEILAMRDLPSPTDKEWKDYTRDVLELSGRFVARVLKDSRSHALDRCTKFLQGRKRLSGEAGVNATMGEKRTQQLNKVVVLRNLQDLSELLVHYLIPVLKATYFSQGNSQEDLLTELENIGSVSLATEEKKLEVVVAGLQAFTCEHYGGYEDYIDRAMSTAYNSVGLLRDHLSLFVRIRHLLSTRKKPKTSDPQGLLSRKLMEQASKYQAFVRALKLLEPRGDGWRKTKSLDILDHIDKLVVRKVNGGKYRPSEGQMIGAFPHAKLTIGEHKLLLGKATSPLLQDSLKLHREENLYFNFTRSKMYPKDFAKLELDPAKVDDSCLYGSDEIFQTVTNLALSGVSQQKFCVMPSTFYPQAESGRATTLIPFLDRNKKIFSNPFVFEVMGVGMCINLHWSGICVCGANLALQHPADREDLGKDSDPLMCILKFNSLKGRGYQGDHEKVLNFLQEMLSTHYTRRRDDRPFHPDNFQVVDVPVPSQQDGFTCLYRTCNAMLAIGLAAIRGRVPLVGDRKDEFQSYFSDIGIASWTNESGYADALSLRKDLAFMARCYPSEACTLPLFHKDAGQTRMGVLGRESNLSRTNPINVHWISAAKTMKVEYGVGNRTAPVGYKLLPDPIPVPEVSSSDPLSQVSTGALVACTTKVLERLLGDAPIFTNLLRNSIATIESTAAEVMAAEPTTNTAPESVQSSTPHVEQVRSAPLEGGLGGEESVYMCCPFCDNHITEFTAARFAGLGSLHCTRVGERCVVNDSCYQRHVAGFRSFRRTQNHRKKVLKCPNKTNTQCFPLFYQSTTRLKVNEGFACRCTSTGREVLDAIRRDASQAGEPEAKRQRTV